jgi:hypothetical protein
MQFVGEDTGLDAGVGVPAATLLTRAGRPGPQ